MNFYLEQCSLLYSLGFAWNRILTNGAANLDLKSIVDSRLEKLDSNSSQIISELGDHDALFNADFLNEIVGEEKS